MKKWTRADDSIGPTCPFNTEMGQWCGTSPCHSRAWWRDTSKWATLFLRRWSANLQGTAKRLRPGLVNKRWKNCVLLPVAGSGTQFCHLLFTKPGLSLLVVPCTWVQCFVNWVLSSLASRGLRSLSSVLSFRFPRFQSQGSPSLSLLSCGASVEWWHDISA